jgi:hypothetical protein
MGLTPPVVSASSSPMFRISAPQIAAFQEENLRDFAREMVIHLRRVLPGRVADLDDDALTRSLRRRLDRALSYGITDRFDALRYLECSYVLGWTDDGPDEEARAILSREGIQAAEKVSLLEQRTATL